MAKHPLLIFPEPARAERTKRHGGGGKVRLPSAQRQAERLMPQFRRIQSAILQNTAAGLVPEKTLVLETIGPIRNFVNAVKKVQGLEWLGEFEIDDIAPEYGFEDEKDPQKQLKGQPLLPLTDPTPLPKYHGLSPN